MQWWVVRNAGGTFVIAEPDQASAAASGSIVAGPFATKAAAQQAMANGASGGTTGNTGNSVVDAILNVTSNLEVREAMLLGSHLESGWSPTAVGDQGTSFGPFQMHIGGALTAQGGTPQQAEDPTWAAQHMLGYYETGVNSVPSSLWSTDPEMASEEAAVKAEGPATSYYNSQGQGAVDAAWLATNNALHGIVSSSGSPSGGTGSGTGGTTTTGALSSFWSGFWNGLLGSAGAGPNFSPVDALERFGLILLGGLLILLGIYMLAGKQILALTPYGRVGAALGQGTKSQGSNEAELRERTRRQDLLRDRTQGEDQGTQGG